MTERRLIESAVGLAGRLSHIPFGTEKAEDCGWRSSRNFTRNIPALRLLGPCKTWIPAEPAHVADSLPPSGTLWEQSRRQQRWLVRNYPEASLGNCVLHDHFVEENVTSPPQQDSGGHTCFFALGELTNTSLQRNTGVPLVVTVSGSANNVLRLTIFDHERRTWSQEPNVAVHLTEVTTEKPALWIDEDLGPIRRVKCIIDHRRYNPTRWLAVQRDSGTTILQPEYRKIPVDSDLKGDASRIAANPLFHVSREQTGGNIHSDVSFNPGTRSNPPQLAIIDERGFWSIWDVGYTRPKSSGKLIPSLRVCGHIDHGVLEQLPYRDRSDTRWHKILWVGRSEDNLDLLVKLDLDADNEESSSQSAFPSLQRSSSVLVCNPQQVRLLDLSAGVYLPDMEFLRHDGVDCILDIHITHDPQYFYVLTTSKLFVVRAYSRPGVEWDQPEKVWSILFSTPHFRSSFDQSLRLALVPGIKSDQATSLVFIYSSTNPWINLFYLEFSPTDPNGVRCRANVPGLSSVQNTMFNSATRALCISPIPIIVKKPDFLTKMGQDLAEQRLKLYQIAALRPDMSLVSALCVCSLSSSVQISVPNVNVGRRSKVRPQKALRYSSHDFVGDDSATSEEGVPNVAHRYIKAFYEHLNSTSASLNKGYASRSARSVYNPFDGARHSVEEALDDGLVPTRTFLQIMPNFPQMSGRSFSDIDWEMEIRTLHNIHPSVVVYTFDMLRSRLCFSVSAPIQEVQSKFLEITHNSLHAEDNSGAHERRVEAISEQVIRDLYLSLYGIRYRNPSNDLSQATAEESLSASQPETLPSSPLRFESPAPASWSQRSNSEAVEGEDPSMTLLRTYIGNGKFVPEKKFELLDKWQLGAKPSDYTFDLDRSADADTGKLRRAKQLARADRKRRRTETLLQLSQEPELPATQPAPETSMLFSSQPRGISSQRQVIHSDPLQAMSQPSAGPFGRRPHKKAKKRKGGF